MSLVFHPPASPVHAEPLTNTRSLAECYVAGRSFRVVQEASFPSEFSKEIHLRENIWLSPTLARHLMKADSPTAIVSQEGQPLVWLGEPESATQIEFRDELFEIRHPWDFLTLQERLAQTVDESRVLGEVHEQAVIEGVMHLGRGSVILPGVYIEGTAIIGENCKIGPNAYLRGATMIGDHCHIGQAVEIKNSILYPGTAIGHLSYCGDSIIGANVNFGAGTITSNFRHDGANHRSMIKGKLVDTGRRKFGTIIGDGVHTGIHTSIYPGRKLWPQTSTRPGDVVQSDLE